MAGCDSRHDLTFNDADGGGPVTTDYTWDVNRSLPVVLQDGTHQYVYGLDLISATDGGGAQTFFTYDGLGSTTDLTDGSGDVTDTYSYDVFGAVRASTGSTPNNWLFTGEQHDSDTDLYYLRARYYDPSTGRFLSADPANAGLTYAYAANNPVNLRDPSGLCIPDYTLPGGCGTYRSHSGKEGGPRGSSGGGGGGGGGGSWGGDGHYAGGGPGYPPVRPHRGGLLGFVVDVANSDLVTALQVADVLPTGLICASGAIFIGVATAGTGAPVGCLVVAGGVSVLAAAGTEIQILAGGCGTTAIVEGSGLNALNLAADEALGDTWPISVPVESALYIATNNLSNCSQPTNGGGGSW